MKAPPVHECKAGDVASAIAMCIAADQPAHAHLFRAVAAGLIVLGNIASREQRVRTRQLLDTTRPCLILIGDDDAIPTGPTGWRCAANVARWAEAAVVHGAGATVDTYQEAITAAVVKRRAVLIETNSAHVMTWAELFRGKPTLTILPRGGEHPTGRADGVVH